MRKQFILWLFEKSQKVYINLFKKNKPWCIYKADLLQFPNESFGKHLGIFLDKNNFELIPKVERHDAYHAITGYGTKVEDEIALQYLCFGNGKQSPYLYSVILIGTMVLPEYLNYYLKSYRIGKKANVFYHFDFKKLLRIPIKDLRSTFFLRSQISFKNIQSL